MNHNNCTAVISVVHPKAGPYLDDFFNSLKNQTKSDFDLLIANDGFTGAENLYKKYDFSGHIINVRGSPVSNRFELIEVALSFGYDIIIFADCDDTFCPNRVARTTKTLEKSSIVVNDLDIMDKEGNFLEVDYFSNRFSNLMAIDLKTITNGNLLGLSNTGIRASVINDLRFLQSKKPKAFDWFFYTMLLSIGESAIFTNETKTNYRIYDGNMAGFPQPIKPNTILRLVEIKKAHYESTQNISNTQHELYHHFSMIESKLKDESWRNNYVDSLLASQKENPLWWENVSKLVD